MIGRLGRGFSLVALSTVVLSACGSDTPIRRPPVVEVTLSSIAIAPATAMIVKGETASFTATGTYSDDTTKDLTLLVRWSVLDSRVASVSAEGVVTALGEGTTTVRATETDGTLMASATITVTPSPLVSIAVEPRTATIAWGGARQLSATATFGDGTTLDVTGAVTWSSSDEAVATVDAAGRVTAVAQGAAKISAVDVMTGISSDDQDASAAITVGAPALVTVTLAPAMVDLPVGRTEQLTALGGYQDGTERDVTASVGWTSTNLSVAQVGNSPGSKGLVTAVAAGVASITATDPTTNVRASITARVRAAEIIAIVVTPTVAVMGRGGNQAFQATAVYSDGVRRDMTAAVTWASSDPNVAVLSTSPGQRGTFIGVGAGTTVISARDPQTRISSDDTGDSATITVTPPALTSIAVLPLITNLPLGLELDYQAVGVYSDASSADLTALVDWSSSEPGVASVDATGHAITVSPGVARIIAVDPVTGISSEASNRSATLTVDPPALLALTVTPAVRAMVIGSTLQLTATGHYTNGVDQNRTTDVTWVPSSNAVTVSSTGLVSAQAEGTVTIVARDPTTNVSSADTNTSASVTISAATLLSIAITPTSTSVPPGADVAFTAWGTYDNGATADVTGLVDWTSSDTSAAEVGTTGTLRGLATASGTGNTTIAAVEPLTGVSSATSNGSATMTIVPAVTMTSLAVSPRPSTVDRNRTRQFTARGEYSNGQLLPVTSSVMWASSDPARATISNAAGTRGLATGVSVGTTVISAVYAPGNVSSAASNRSSTLTVNIGIQTLAATWTGPWPDIDSTPNYGVNVGSVVFTAGQFPAGAVITDVDVSINFLKTDGSCASPASGGAFHNETNFALLSPQGTQVILAQPGTWSGGTVMPPLTVTFDQQAAAVPSNTPVAGSFLPSGGDLSVLNGQNPTGTWILQAGDAAGGDPLCVNAYTVTITAQ
ncbi:Ig-like domain-containing protein [Myxococcota bacterium]|nr:Ig-like domain-containing protein [Myxococcota bacterium]